MISARMGRSPIQGQPLRTPKAAKKNVYLACGRNAIDAVEAGGSRPGDEKLARRAECQVIRRYGRLDRGKNENFPVGRDLENRAAAVAHVEAAGLVEGDSRGDTHAFDPLQRAAVRRHAI